MLRKVSHIDIFVFLLVACSMNFFSATFAQEGLVKHFSYGVTLIAILLSVPYVFQSHRGFSFPVLVIGLSVLFSVFMSYFSWGQSLSMAGTTIPYALWFFFFFLLGVNYSIHKLEMIVLIYGVMYVGLFFFQFFNSDIVYFGYKDEFVQDRGITRIDFPGGGLFYLAYFISLSKMFSPSRMRFFCRCFVVIGLVVTVLQVTRQSILLVFGITLFNFLWYAPKRFRVAIVALFVGSLCLFFSSQNSLVNGLIQKQKETTSEGSKYIRVVAGDYFLSDFSPNFSSRVFGNGVPNNTSDYGKYTLYLQHLNEFHISDIGFIGFYALFGVFSLAFYLLIYLKAFLLKIPRSVVYTKYFIVFTLFTGLTSDYSYSWNYIFSIVVVIYAFQRVYDSQRGISHNFQTT